MNSKSELLEEVRRLWPTNHELDTTIEASIGFDRVKMEELVKEEMKSRGYDFNDDIGVQNYNYGELLNVLNIYREIELRDALSAHFNQIKEIVCVDFKYCERRSSGQLESEGVMLAVSIAELLGSKLSGTTIPIVALSVYLVKKRVLDRWCGCAPSSKIGEVNS